MKLVLLLFLCGVCRGFEDMTIPEYIHTHQQMYGTLESLLNTTNLIGALSGTGPFTLFAPTDAAFQKLGASTLQGLTQTPMVLAEILKYHVIGEFVLIPVISGSASKTTLEGQLMMLNRSQSGLVINGNAHTIHPSDIVVNNGVIQLIDAVLLPPVMPTTPAPTTTTGPPTLNIAQTLLQDDARFKDLFLAILLADLIQVMDSNDLTIFAPIDSAFAAYKNNLLNPTDPNAQKIYQEVLKYHIVPGARSSDMLRDGQTLYTLHGTSLNIKVGQTGVTVNGAHVIDADIKATNGVIHAIDKLLLPSDLGSLTQG